MTSAGVADASTSAVGQRSSHSRYRGMTRSTWVCCSITSETRMAYGSRVRRQGRSRPCSANQASRALSTDADAIASGGRKRETDGCAALGPALGPDAPALSLDEATGNREAEARAAARTRRIGSPKTLEHALRGLRGQTVARVLDDDLHLVRARLETADTGLDERGELGTPKLERQRPGVDATELEEIFDEPGQRENLFAQSGKVLLRLGESVLDRFQHRLHRGDRRTQIMACPGNELPAGVEELLQALSHPVEGGAELGELRRAVLGRPRLQVAPSQCCRGSPDPIERARDAARQDDAGTGRSGRRSGGDREDLHVVAHVEHHPAREEHDRPRQHDREKCKAGELKTHRRQPQDEEPGGERDGERGARDDEGQVDHRENRYPTPQTVSR